MTKDFFNTNVLEDVLKLAASELNKNGSIGYTMPDGKYHMFIYVDEPVSGEKYYVVEPNKIVDGAHEPMGDTASAKYGNFGELMVACSWCMEQFEADRHISNDRLSALLHNSIICLEEQGFDREQLEIDLGITSEEYDMVMDDDLSDFRHEVEYKSYRFSVDYNEVGKPKSFQIGVFAPEKPDNQWLAQKIYNYFSAHYHGSPEKAIASVVGIDVSITDATGEYVDSDEIYGEDLQALFEHSKTERYKFFVDDEVHYAMLTKAEAERVKKDIAGELNCQFEIIDETGEKIESGIIDFIEKDESVSYICPETVTGYVGQVLDECEIDEKARGLLSELYNEALNELNSEKVEKPGLDSIISAAKQRQENNTSDNNISSFEPER